LVALDTEFDCSLFYHFGEILFLFQLFAQFRFVDIQDDLNNDQAGDPSSPVVIHRQDNQDPVGQYELLYDLQLYFERCYISNVEVCHINKCLLPL